MDPSRFGRVLGTGTRLAARTLVSAAAAASAENPASARSTSTAAPAPSPPAQPFSAPPEPPQQPVNAAASSLRQKTAQTAAQTAARASITAKGVKQGSKRFGEAAWGPVARLSGVLWLEVMGTFFGLFAFLASAGAWKQRAIFHAHPVNPQAYERFLLVSSVALLFTYFCVTSFIRAKRRERQR